MTAKIGISVFSGEILEIFVLTIKEISYTNSGLAGIHLGSAEIGIFEQTICKWECRIFDKSYFFTAYLGNTLYFQGFSLPL